MSLSPEVARFLLGVVDQLQLSVAAPDFAEIAALVVRAKAELGAVAAPVPEIAAVK